MQETFVFFSMDPCTQFDWSTSCLNFLQSNWFQGSRCWADWRIIENKTNLKKENTDMISSSCLLVVGVHLFYVPFVFFNLIGHCLNINIKWIEKSQCNWQWLACRVMMTPFDFLNSICSISATFSLVHFQFSSHLHDHHWPHSNQSNNQISFSEWNDRWS